MMDGGGTLGPAAVVHAASAAMPAATAVMPATAVASAMAPFSVG
jgi:hypothetical protein